MSIDLFDVLHGVWGVSQPDFKQTNDIIETPTILKCPICLGSPVVAHKNDYDWYPYTKDHKHYPSGGKIGSRHFHFTCKNKHYWCGSGRPIEAKLNSKEKIIEDETTIKAEESNT